jgi:hypothetical protein
MGKKKDPQEVKKIMRQVLLTEKDFSMLQTMLRQDDLSLSPFVRRLIRTEAGRRGLDTAPTEAVAIQEI